MDVIVYREPNSLADRQKARLIHVLPDSQQANVNLLMTISD